MNNTMKIADVKIIENGRLPSVDLDRPLMKTYETVSSH